MAFKSNDIVINYYQTHVVARLLSKSVSIKERFLLAENLRGSRCLPAVISKVLPVRMRKLITARARKNKRTARMLAKTIRYPYYSLGSTGDLWLRRS